jgi:hypothetical protein
VNRRGFLRGMLGVGAAAAAGKHLVDDEPQYKAQLIYGPAITELAPLKREGESVVYDPCPSDHYAQTLQA